MGIDGVVKLIKNILRWFAVVFFMAGGYVCITDYGSPLVGIFWFWTAIIVSPLPRRLRDSLELKISDKAIGNFTWIVVGLAVGLLFLGVIVW